MRCNKKLYYSLLAITLLVTPYAATHAFQTIGTVPAQSAHSTRYLNGELLSWHSNTIKTTVGDFNVSQGVVVLDQTYSRNRTYMHGSKKPKVQLTFSNNHLTQVVIHH